MFNPWTNLQPNQPFPFFGPAPTTQSTFVPPVFAQLFDFGSLMQSMQKVAQGQVPDFGTARQMEDLIRTFSATPFMTGMPNPAISQQNPWTNLFGQAGTLPSWNAQVPQTPALGITREYQEDWTHLSELQREYESALREFGELFQDFSRRANEAFTASVSTVDGEQDFGTLSRKWIDCCEKEFQTIANTPEFATRLGNLINANLKLIQHSNRIQENLAVLQGQPTRGELNELHRRNIESQLEIDALKDRIRQLESSSKAKPKSAPRKRRTTKKTDK